MTSNDMLIAIERKRMLAKAKKLQKKKDDIIAFSKEVRKAQDILSSGKSPDQWVQKELETMIKWKQGPHHHEKLSKLLKHELKALYDRKYTAKEAPIVEWRDQDEETLRSLMAGEVPSLEEMETYQRAVNTQIDFLATRLAFIPQSRQICVLNQYLGGLPLEQKQDVISQLLLHLKSGEVPSLEKMLTDQRAMATQVDCLATCLVNIPPSQQIAVLSRYFADLPSEQRQHVLAQLGDDSRIESIAMDGMVANSNDDMETGLGLVVDESGADDSVVDESVVDKSVADESVANESGANESSADELDDELDAHLFDESDGEESDVASEKVRFPLLIWVWVYSDSASK
jgi:hypothetical protein